MARKEKIITIQDREQELTFKIKEMPAVQLESWLCRALQLAAEAGFRLPRLDDEEALNLFLLDSASAAALGRLDYEKARPLLEEMLGCCSRMVEGVEERCTSKNVDAYIQNVSTLVKLRMEAVKVNMGFFPESESNSPERPATANS